MKKAPFFTIIVVSYNAGDKLFSTLESIKDQTFSDYQVLIKDGMSTDGSIEKLKARYEPGDLKDARARRFALYESCDNGIYHAMNIAVGHLKELCEQSVDPSYVYFLNCGDLFSGNDVLRKVHDFIVERNERKGTTIPSIYYGDIFDSSTGSRVPSNPEINDYACYRNVPSHQACFYDMRLMFNNPFELKYKVRADYEQFLRCFYRDRADAVYMDLTVADYEGGGFSDQNKKISEEERKEIIQMYLDPASIRKYDLLRVITLSGLRTKIASNKVTAGAYNAVKNAIYAARGKNKHKE